ncbi:iron complex transport system substrate-binding protein [Hamadaea flava]|uniref:ABC transporter substrate-binding protein n=1 Tax=Hamadaea flava TaxID=1742688 RepID=A0ABV8LHM5_9ACTN|nr:iron-siderophore ABC transporter substrate-binding protein [Hamadaea flava]MCP2325416.1 iron complex transport system substrate-binding protein [Hamadaea flava]
MHRRLVTLALVAGLAVAGCSSSPSAPGDATREITHAMGTTKIPITPKRVVVLDTDKIDTALTLGVTPVGAAVAGEAKSWPTYFGEDKLSGITEVGTLQEPNLEKIASLKPDLILGSKFRQEKYYDELTAIAPTVFTAQVGSTWKENFLLDGDALGHKAEATTALEAYEKRAKEVGTKLGDPSKIKVSIARFLPDALRAYGPTSFSGIVVGDTGLGRPEFQLLADKEDKRFVAVSAEKLNLLDGDVIFVAAYGEKAAQQQATVSAGPLWQGLSAVKAGKAYVVKDEVWMTGIGVTAANKILDDLATHLSA